MERRVLVFLVCVAVVCSGCATKTTDSGTTSISTRAAVESDSSKPALELPHAHGPLERQHRAMRPLEEVFRRVESLRNLNRFTVADLKSIQNAGFTGVLLSGCDLEVLKSLVASDWAPVVIIRSPVGPKHLRAVAGYDDDAERITIVDPMDFAEARLEYSEFAKQWDDSQGTCLIIFSQRGSVDMIRSALIKYLPAEKVDSVIIRK